MNKTLTVNIGGSIFHIDENAFHKLDQYLNTIKQSIPLEERDEVTHDIEIRIAELFSERLNDTNQVITVTDVQEIISIMGNPEDYVLEDDNEFSKQESRYRKQGKLYRDGEKAMVGGVLAGLAHYFKIDVVWVRLIFLILVFFYGTGILLYFILWIIMPEAKTTSQILEMHGEPININTIEKKVRENVNYVTDKINNIDYENVKRQTKTAGKNSAKWIRTIFGILFIFCAISSFISLAIGFTIFIVNQDFLITEIAQSDFPVYTDIYPYWALICLLAGITFLPVIGIFLIGLKLLYPHLKYVFATCIALFILWIFSFVLFCIPFMDFKNYTSGFEYSKNTITITRDSIFDIQTTDALKIAVVSEDFFNNNSDSLALYSNFIHPENLKETPVEIEILPTFQDNIYTKIEIEGSLLTRYTAKGKKQSLNYSHNFNAINYRLADNALLISDQILDLTKKEFTNPNSKIKYYIYVPKGKRIILNQNIEPVLSDDDFLQKGIHIYEMTEQNELKCIDC